MNVLEKLKENPIVAVIRKADESNIVPIIEALSRGGVKAVEITAETPRVTNLVEKAVAAFDDDVLIGVGTVLDPETARATIIAGAKFIVSPTVNVDTLRLTNRYGVLNISGALTPTEILTAYENGAQMVKVFPANVFGPDYIKSVHGPLPHIPLMVTGGITLENMNDYFTKGGMAVGIGSNLVNVSKLQTEEDYQQLTNTARQYIDEFNKIKQG
ncbi:bifunctional 4-hydroxy-2-oxoglutarate aldolase/2-dehydro-3-deoxy-phosphogluconate aldolase [Ornithinibacillus halotolerans]|uniref:2-dehydro-3-deoxy-phosphogluconate aldolase n=1 Tax=Ornithinibacillus halotolerans TaxID=1274357 RepID=A0A916SCV1_9BACI|nr:bifunctional 4-hydroxy-2-oxoglutarate aldolase/2-dehydro-3-deoxy-phosphogluconate aldolase [Ornithinibacillus halotolerans]GGA90915.1 2-dehydro-3-deoxy-phosphogluconate aldolase [Ornithinibacillus halotolerans]